MNTVQVKIENIAYGGRGVARLDGRVIFVTGALPGETVTANVTATRKNFLEAHAVEIIDPSPLRQPPACPYAFTGGNATSHCPGCCYQHASYQNEISFKQSQLLTLLKRIGKLNNPHCLEPVPAPCETNYRNKLVLHCLPDDTGMCLGYFTEDNSSVIDIESCPLGMKQLNSLLKTLRNDANFVSSLRAHMAVTLRHTEADGAISWKGKDPSDVILTESTPFGRISVPREGFFQINPAVASLVINSVTEIIRQKNPGRVVDLYCGAGVFALSAAGTGVKSVVGIEIDHRSVTAARNNAQTLNLRNISFQTASVERSLPAVLSGNSAGETLVIADPPRRGLDKQAVHAICKLKPRDVIYVSCAPDTLARDVALFAQAGYVLESSRLFDMFPRTPYFESITCLRAGAEGK
jgi:tRNA/tmRNA/rRNA uracil-C5-methylase (TrmA/RlmC/RlmD family)